MSTTETLNDFAYALLAQQAAKRSFEATLVVRGQPDSLIVQMPKVYFSNKTATEVCMEHHDRQLKEKFASAMKAIRFCPPQWGSTQESYIDYATRQLNKALTENAELRKAIVGCIDILQQAVKL